jgi:hypothetical protein
MSHTNGRGKARHNPPPPAPPPPHARHPPLSIYAVVKRPFRNFTDLVLPLSSRCLVWLAWVLVWWSLTALIES